MNSQTLLYRYLRQQREFGLDELTFPHGCEIKRLLGAAPSATTVQTPAPAQTKTSVASQDNVLKIPVKETPKGECALSKLSKITPVNSLNIRPPISPVKKNSVGLSKRDLLKNLYFDVLKCSECQLGAGGKKIVFGAGNAEGRLMIVGGVPSLEDEKLRLPFKGDVEELFKKMVQAMKLKMERDVFVTYLLKCRVPERGPQQSEIQSCRLIFDRQLDIISPQAILVFGDLAANALLGRNDTVENLRNMVHQYKGTPLVVTYALELLGNDQVIKRKAWQDLKSVMAILDGNGTNGL